MADRTAISWTDSTFNPVVGCTRISPGCDFCYAEALDKRYGGNHWGPHAEYRVTSSDNWRKPRRWNRKAVENGIRHKVFCASLCDVFDNRWPEGVRDRLWALVRETPMLDWQMLTKRPTNITKFLPPDWGHGYSNVWLGVTVENRQHGLPRIDVLREIPAKVRFLSVEPLLEDLGPVDLSGIHWAIVGGESGPRARPMDASWVLSVRRQCHEQDVAFFFKQWGGRAADKGGCELDGLEAKEWPKVA